MKSEAQTVASDSLPIPAPGIGSRIGKAAALLGTRESAYSEMRVSSATLQRYIKEDVAPPFDAMARLCLAARVRMEWLATGEGEMRADAPQAAPATASQPLRSDELTMALQLAEEALGNKILPRDKRVELIALTYELLVEGLPEAKVLHFARRAAA